MKYHLRIKNSTYTCFVRDVLRFACVLRCEYKSYRAFRLPRFAHSFGLTFQTFALTRFAQFWSLKCLEIQLIIYCLLRQVFYTHCLSLIILSHKHTIKKKNKSGGKTKEVVTLRWMRKYQTSSIQVNVLLKKCECTELE